MRKGITEHGDAATKMDNDVTPMEGRNITNKEVKNCLKNMKKKKKLQD